MRAVRESVYYLKALLLAGGQEVKNLSLEEFYETTIDDKRYYRTQFSYFVDSDNPGIFGQTRTKVYKNVFIEVGTYELRSIETQEKDANSY